jgi:hypothetical protein
MDILVLNGKAHDFFPEGAPELHPDLANNIVSYDGEVESGWLWDGTQFTPPTLTAEEARAIRDDILKEEVDPIVSNPLRWNSLSDTQQSELVAYREELLNVPQQEGFPTIIEWPVKPE